MSSSSPFPAPDELPEDDRERMMEILEEGIREVHYKIEDGRIRDEDKEKVRIQWIRALGYCIDKYRQLQKDADAADLESRIEQLESP